MILDDLAGVRAGDKGDTLILAVHVRDRADLPRVLATTTPQRVAAHFDGLLTAPVIVREVPDQSAVVVVLPGALGGGVTGSATLDGHGKALGHHLLSLEVPDGP
ncbi:AtuA-related protein [Actinomycetospora sp. CA-084318]|uniref:AtuA-related protein n=1 Tax=Actinomycetospora sp. CA-084318 TaxID=3239892 RepID=UPI003D962E22